MPDLTMLYCTVQKSSWLTGEWNDIGTFTKPVEDNDLDLFSALADKILRAGGSTTAQISKNQGKSFVDHMVVTSKNSRFRTILKFRSI